MPASMISPDTGSRWNVSGSSMAMVAIGPMPGSTPISVPTSAPMSAKPTFAGVSATPKPVARLLRSSIRLPDRPHRDRQTETENEDRPRQDRKPERGGDRLHRLDSARRQRTDPDQQQDRQNKPELLDGKREGGEARGHHHDREEPREAASLRRGVLLEEPLDENGDTEAQQCPAQEARDIAGAHAQRSADRIVARDKKSECGNADEHQTGEHVLARDQTEHGVPRQCGRCGVLRAFAGHRLKPSPRGAEREFLTPRFRSSPRR